MQPKFAFTVNAPDTREKSLAWSGDMEEIFGKLSQFGYDGVELFVRDPNEFDVESVKHLLAKNGLQAVAVGTGPIVAEDKIFLTHDDPEVRKEAIARARTVVDFTDRKSTRLNSSH